MQLYINDQPADLAEDSPIALTFQINNLAEVRNQQGNTSNQFKLPLTQRNRRILGFPDDVTFNTGALYNRYTAKIVQDGLEIVPYGIAEINSIDNDAVSMTVLSGNVDFFDAIEGSLYDMGDEAATTGANKPFAMYDHDWNLKNIVASQSKTDGWIWPVVDYGRLSYDATSAQQNIDVRDMRPGFFLKTAIETIAKNAGFSINPDSSLLQDPLYNRLIVQFAGDMLEHGSTLQNSTGNYAHNAVMRGDQRIVEKSTGNIMFDSFEYRPKIHIKGTVTVVLNVSIDGSMFNGSPPTFTIGVNIRNENDHGSNYNVTELALQPDKSGQTSPGNFLLITFNQEFKNQKLSADIELSPGEVLNINFRTKEYKFLNATIHAGSTFIFERDNKEILYGENIQCERILPDISQKELLKDTLQRFGIICQADNTNRVITLASFRDIVNNIPIAKNWTAKCLDQGKTITFQLGGYAQTNTLKYKEDENVLPLGFADSKILIADKNLPASADLFESQFAPSLNRPYIGGSTALINKVEPSDSSQEYSIATQPRLLINQTVSLRNTGKKIKFTEGNAATDIIYNDDISAPYFYKPDAEELPGGYGPASLHFDDLRKKYYPELEKILQQTKKVVRYFMLNPRDILDLDLLIPVYLQQDGAYYYINKIDSWRKGQPCKVELVRL